MQTYVISYRLSKLSSGNGRLVEHGGGNISIHLYHLRVIFVSSSPHQKSSIVRAYLLTISVLLWDNFLVFLSVFRKSKTSVSHFWFSLFVWSERWKCWVWWCNYQAAMRDSNPLSLNNEPRRCSNSAITTNRREVLQYQFHCASQMTNAVRALLLIAACFLQRALYSTSIPKPSSSS